MRVVVTGGSGLVGRVVIHRLKERHQVVNFDRVEHKARSRAAKWRAPARTSGAAPARERHTRESSIDQRGVKFVAGDIFDDAALRKAFRGADAVVHLAAIPNPLNDPPNAVMESNVMGAQCVADAAVKEGVGRVIHASSDSTYGFVFGPPDLRPCYLPLDEEHPLQASDSYGLAKALGEQIMAAHTRMYGLTTISLRYCWVWVEGQYPDLVESERNTPEWWRRTLCGYIDARDVAQAVDLCLTADISGHECFLLSAADIWGDLTTLELVACIYPEGPPPICHIQRYLEQPYASLFDWGHAHEVLGYQPKYNLRG